MFHIRKKGRDFLNNEAEERNRLRFAVDNILKRKKINSIAIVSASDCEGKTSVVYNLALSFNRKKKEKIIIVDCNFINPAINMKFPSDNKLKEYNLLNENEPVSRYINKVYDYVDILTVKCDSSILDERPVLENLNMILISLMADYDLVIIDTSSILVCMDTEIISELVDGVLLVVNPGKVKQHEVIAAKEKLLRCGANIIGIVINDYKSGSFNDENTFIFEN